jgi:hypothetical protein
MDKQEEFFDIRFICGTCNGEGQIRKRTKQGPAGNVTCRRCNGTKMVADGRAIKMLIDEIEAVKGKTANEITHITTLKELVTVRFNDVGVEIVSTTGHFLIITAGDNHLAVAVKPKGAPNVEEWEITQEKSKSDDDNERD